MKSGKQDLTTGPIYSVLIKMAMPMVLGMLSVVAYNIADAYFAAKLGVAQLAAISFTFPIVMLVGSIAVGLGIGSSALVSKAAGEKDFVKVAKISSAAIALSFIIVSVISTIGLFTIKPLFTMLGADEHVYPYVYQYMSVWYFVMYFLVVPMTGNGILRALGDAKTSGMIMAMGALVNVGLNPVLMWGLGPFPEMGIRGLAVATLVSRMLNFVAIWYILGVKEKLITIKFDGFAELKHTWKNILKMSIPTAINNAIQPVFLGVLIKMASGFGKDAVAAIGAGSRIDGLSMLIMMALCSVFMPFVGQNWGAKNFDRINKAKNFSYAFSMAMGIFSLLMLYLFGRNVAGIFSEEENVIKLIELYLLIIPITYGLSGIAMIVSVGFNAVEMPFRALNVNLIRIVVLTIPLTYIGSCVYGYEGLLYGIVAGNVLASFVSIGWLNKTYTKLEATIA